MNLDNTPAPAPEAPATDIPAVEVPLVVAATPEQAPIEEGAPTEEILIGDKVFTSNDEAIAYARQLQGTVATNDAYQQGINDALAGQQNNQSVTQEPVDEVPFFDSAEFYENPQEVMKRVTKQATDKAVDIVRQEAAQKAQTDQLWNEFYSKYPKLQKSDRLVKQELDDNWALLGNMPDASKAMDILAQKATARINSMLADYLPAQELPLTKQATSPGTQTNVTPPAATKPVLDFMSQAKNHYKL